MGYYDHQYQEKPRRSKTNWFTAFASAIIGGSLVVFSTPFLANAGFLPYHIVPKNQTQLDQPASTSGSSLPLQQTVQVSVSSQVVDAVEQVADAIVGVVNIQQSVDFFSRSTESVDSGTGSGVVFKKAEGKAYIVTNFHVVQGAQKVEVSLADGERVPAILKGYDTLTDLAVLEIDGEHVKTVAQFGDSDSLRPGEPAIAIGNPLGLQFSRTVTQGIISAKDRSVEVSKDWEINVLQTDAAINPGNSGGALVNIQGQVIGINSLKIAQRSQGYGSSFPVEGMGFAIPINEAIPVIEDLLVHGEVQRAYLGISTMDLTNVDSFHWKNTLKLPDSVKQGVVIADAPKADTPAAQAGLQELDVIVELDGHEIANATQLRRYLFTKKSVGETVQVKVFRGGLSTTIEVKLGKAKLQQ